MGKFGVIQKWCSILVRIHEILAGGGVPRFWSTYIHTHDRLDKLRSALADAQLKTVKYIKIHRKELTSRYMFIFYDNDKSQTNPYLCDLLYKCKYLIEHLLVFFCCIVYELLVFAGFNDVLNIVSHLNSFQL